MTSEHRSFDENYDYLMNNNDLIATCAEALAENFTESVNNKSGEVKDLLFLSYTSPSSIPSIPSISSSPSSLITQKLSPKGLLSSTLPSTSSLTAVSSSSSLSNIPGSVDKVSLEEFSKWLTRTEEHLLSVCYCQPKNVNAKSSHHTQRVIQAEIQSVGQRFINSLRANAKKVDQSLLTAQQYRWHVLWLKAIEYSVLVEDLKICPNHTAWNRERSSTSHSNSKRFKHGQFSEGKENIMMRNRRIQTNMIGIGAGPGLNETFNIPPNGKYEIIHKDIGYSSDADMSDACEPSSCTNPVNANAKSPRKRHRRRRPRIEDRPWSFHADWTGWDYYLPPLGFSGEYRSSEDLNSFENEKLVRSLTEFGENYEKWFKTDDGILRASEDLASHEEESSRSFTDSLGGNHSDRPWSKASGHYGGDGMGGATGSNRSKSYSKLSRGKFYTSSPNITFSSFTGPTETEPDSLDFTVESQVTCDSSNEVVNNATLPTGTATFTIKDARKSATIFNNNTIKSNNNNHEDNDDDNDTDEDADGCDSSAPFPVEAKAQSELDSITSIEDDNDIAMNSHQAPSFLNLTPPSPVTNTTNNNSDDYNKNIHSYNTSSTQTYSQQLTTSSRATITTINNKSNNKQVSTASTSTKYFFIYLTITLLMAVILSILVATLSPISPQIQKSYPNRSPPN